MLHFILELKYKKLTNSFNMLQSLRVTYHLIRGDDSMPYENDVRYEGQDAVLIWANTVIGRVNRDTFEVVAMLLREGSARIELVRQLVKEGYSKGLAIKIVLHAEDENKKTSHSP